MKKKIKTIRWLLVALCAVIIAIFVAFAVMHGTYLNWDYNDPELAVAATILHGFEFLFIRVAPIVLVAAMFCIVLTYKKR